MTETESPEYLRGMIWKANSVYPEVAAYLLKQNVKSVYHAACGNGDLLLMLKRARIPPTHLCGCDIVPSNVDTAKRRTGIEDIVINDFGNPKLVIPRRVEALVLIGCLWEWNGKPTTRERSARLLRNAIDTLKWNGIILFDWPGDCACVWQDVLETAAFFWHDAMTETKPEISVYRKAL